MGDQPGAGGSRSYKIRGYTRERQSAKPYARPSAPRKGVIETVKDFFSPSWLVDLFKGNQRSRNVERENASVEEGNDEASQTVEENSNSTSNERSCISSDISATSKVGNGQLRSSFGPGYFSSVLRQREVSSDISTTSRPSRTFGLSSGFDRLVAHSTSSAISEGFEREVPRSRHENENTLQMDTVVEEDDVITYGDRQESVKPERIITSTPALCTSASSKRKAKTSIFGEPISVAAASLSRTTTTAVPHFFSPLSESQHGRKGNTSIFGEPVSGMETSTSRTASSSRPSLFVPSNESRPGPQPFSFSKNRPSFSTSAFGSPFSPKANPSVGFDSPFYQGKTTYGGASSKHSTGHKRLRRNSPTLGEPSQPVRKVITPKPLSSVGSSSVTSQTAKRILEALESMSSPLIDARKIPTPPISPSASPLSFSPSQRKRPPSRAVGSSRTLKAHFPGPPVQDLSAPQQASISRLKSKDTTSPDTAAMSSSSLLSTATTTIPTFSKSSVSSFTPTPLPISLSPSSSDTKAGGKVKSSRSRAHYSQIGRAEGNIENEVVNPIPEVKAAVPLPLPNGKSLPSFSFTPSAQSRVSNSQTNELSPKVSSTGKEDLTKNNFKFSKPTEKVQIDSQDSSSMTNQNSSNKITFSFSQPATKSNVSSNDMTSVVKQGNGLALKEKQMENSVEPNNNLLNKFAPLPGSWTCDTCLVSNKSTDTKCVACQASKPSTGNPAPKRLGPIDNDLMRTFAPPADSHMLSNDSSKSKCVTYESLQPGAKQSSLPSKTLVNTDSNLMKKFAPSKGEWDCDTCLVPNKSTERSCVACQSPKPGGGNTAKETAITFGVTDNSLAAKFAPPSGHGTCLGPNKADDSSCVDSNTVKPGSKQGSAISSRGFSFSGGQSISSSPFTFGVKKNSSDANAASLPLGVETKGTEEAEKKTFMFGSDAEGQSKKSDSNVVDSSNELPASVTFGVPAAQMNVKDEGEKPNISLPFTFGQSTVNHVVKDNSSKTPTFSFGIKTSQVAAKASTDGVTSEIMQASTASDKPNSIAAAATFGFLKVPEIKDPIKSTADQTSVQKVTGMNIAEAAKAGLLAVPTSGEKKDNENPPPNVNLFTPSKAQSAPATKQETGSGFSFAESSSAAALTPFQFGAPKTSSSATTEAFGQLQGGTASSKLPFQFGGLTTSAASSSSQVTSTAAVTQFPFSFSTNTIAPVKTATDPPFNFTANTGAPVSTPATTFSFSANTASAGTISTGAGGMFQFSAGSADNKPTGQGGSLPLFQFGASNPNPVTSTVTQQGQVTFGMPTLPESSSSNPAKPFGFNPGSTGQGLPFPVPKVSEVSTDQPAIFSFSTQSAKQDANFPTFGALQPSSNQASAMPFMFGSTPNSTSTASEETMEADGSNSATNLFASSGTATGPQFGSVAPNSGFNFGAPSAPGVGNFNFGATQANTGVNTFAFAPSASGSPAFAANIAPGSGAPAQGGFNFAPPASNNSIASPGVFNLGGGSVMPQGNAMFTAGVGRDSGTSQRRMKKAVRRANKR